MSMSVSLSQEELIRYDRQLKVLGIEGQKRLKRATVTLVGLGGLGSIVSIYLVAMGIGRIILIDRERVELSNLNRQILYNTKDVGRYKVRVAVKRLSEINPTVDIEGVIADISKLDIGEFVKVSDIVIDGTDNWRSRFLLNEVCVKKNVPFIHAGVKGIYGQLFIVIPHKGPCLRCLIVRKPKEEHGIPILGITPAILASLEVLEATKILTGIGTPSVGYLVLFNGRTMSLKKLRVYRNPNCPVCGTGKNTS